MKIRIISLLLTLVAAVAISSGRPDKEVPEKAIQQTLVVQVGNFSRLIEQTRKILEKQPLNIRQLQQQFLQIRLAYKAFEWAAEYYTPTITRFVNGPPVPEVEVSGSVFEPDGLQVIEALLFPATDSIPKKELEERFKRLAENTARYKEYFQTIDLYNWQIMDAAKLQVFRVITLGITGFDDPLSEKSMEESAVSLQSLQAVMAHYTTAPDDYGFSMRLQQTVQYLQRHTNFNKFDRALFITTYANPLSVSLAQIQRHSDMPLVKYNRLLNQDAETLFDENAFNANAYLPEPDHVATAKKIALGKKLFYDPILSGSQTRSCSSCHQPEKAFTDGLVKNADITGKGTISRNTPTLINAALQPAQFYDLRAIALEDQVADVIANKDEMHGSMLVSAKRLWNDKTYRALFAEAFPQKEREAIDTMEIMNAVSSYVRSLTFLNSRFDEYMRGNKAALNKEEVNGFNLFMGKAKCATCHYMPLFNGALPPKYMRIETEVIGVPLTSDAKAIDSDMGSYVVIPVESNEHAFKTTTVRNAARTAPYMHNGVFKTLEEVVDFYDKGGGVGAGLKISNQTLDSEPLRLTRKEKRELVAFIKSLDSKINKEVY
ncbi:cytochrome C peroxidase [Pedobacter sp. BS3]|uniref:cytochrome-c peroxidase n=1 Tax=Pedobacter sp. BS3 TaxID=2567937 RepID=UPI0011EBA924|nr:cytochrome c peroxidase [Pedobacter sp. BS3]TZF84669.1 cytochrome C peroxidase [Pedobacter sp. BS3]